jgi:uncharacterized protein (TIGR00266 family)
MQAKISGTTLPVLQIAIEPGEKVISHPGEFSWMTSNVRLETSALTAGARGIWGVLGRAITGGGLFMNEFTAAGGTGLVAFAAKVPGSIMELELRAGKSYLVHRHGFLAATDGIELSVGFQKSLGAGLFGGDGLLLQRIAGMCTAWIELGGEIVSYDLAAGETLQVHPGHIGLFEDSVNFDVTFIRGIKNAIFGGDGLFVAQVTGPGKVWLQTLTMPNLAHSLSPYLGREASDNAQSAGAGAAGGVAAALIKDIFKS